MKIDDIIKNFSPGLSQVADQYKNFTIDNSTITALNNAAKAIVPVYNTAVLASRALSEIYKISDFAYKINAFAEVIPKIPEVSRLISASVATYQALPQVLSALNVNADSLAYLQNIKLAYGDIIKGHKHSFGKIEYLLPSQKKLLLRSEQKQKDTLLLGESDLQNIDLLSLNVSNTIAFVNELSGSPDTETYPAGFQLINENELSQNLHSIDNTLLKMWQGARDILNSNNPEKVRHVSVSLRELTKGLINQIIPDDIVIDFYIKNGIVINGKPSLEQKITCFFSEESGSRLLPFISSEVETIVKLINLLSKLTHNKENNITDDALIYIISKVESVILLLFSYSKYKDQQELPHA